MPNEIIIFLESKIHPLFHNRYLRDLGQYSMSAASAQILMMVYTILLARVLGPNQYGFLIGSFALTGLTSFLVNWGLDTWLLRESGSLEAPLAWSGRVIRIKFGLGVIWVLLLVFSAPLIKPDLFNPALMLVCALDVWCDSVFVTNLAVLNIQNRIQAGSRLIFFSKTSRLIGALILILTINI